MTPAEHLPVLVREVVDLLSPHEGGLYVDATVGLGGHSEEILKMIGRNGRLIGIDRDDAALRIAGERLEDPRVLLKKSRFSEMGDVIVPYGKADGILFDLGVSMMQLRKLERGFSFLSDERLDMRMDRTQSLTAWEVVNHYSEKELIRVLKEYGEEPRAPRIARAIGRYRKEADIDTCSELAELISRSVGRRGRIHPATRTFQALRIEVNDEMRELQWGLNSSLNLLKSGGRMCVISYHSLEDRIVKNFIRENARGGALKPLTKKPVTPGIKEIRENPSSRSAKMRGAERL
ncbi:MAG: 16S rRNA (cytosine(1402)-N(4))-methyltransferase RsmH [Candidatus Sulfobium sp.]|jgi:16S rRNA (cytosine1402-N4)-methyltransferase